MREEAVMRSNEIKFEDRKIITTGLLNRMYRTPMEILEFKFAEYSDGIISGMNIEVHDNEVRNNVRLIKISKGLYKLDGTIYVLDKEVELEYEYIQGLRYVVGFEIDQDENICIETSLSDGDQVKEKRIKIVVLSGKEYKDIKIPDKYVICRFTGKACMPTKCNELLLTGSYMNLVDCLYSSFNKSTFHPIIFKIIKQALLEKANKHPMDYIIINELSCHETLSFQFMEEYIKAARLKCPNNTRRELLRTFIEAIMTLVFKVNVENYADSTENGKNKQSAGEGVLLE